MQHIAQHNLQGTNVITHTHTHNDARTYTVAHCLKVITKQRYWLHDSALRPVDTEENEA